MASELVDELVRVASEETGIFEDAIWGRGEHPRRGRNDAARTRQAIWCALREHGWQLMAIGAEFNRDHSTVFTGIGRAAMASRTDHDLRYLIDKLAETIDAFQGRTRMGYDVHRAIERIDREITWAQQLRTQLTERLDGLQYEREALAQVVDPVVTRGLTAVV